MIRHDSSQNKIQSFALVISILIAFGLSCCFALNSIGFGSSIKADEVQLDSLINPNDASLASLARLPGIGIARAEAIIAYRRNFTKTNGKRESFQSCDDLQKVNGIGPKTAENIREWLKF